MFYEVIPLKLFRSGAGVLTYSYDTSLSIGAIVTIPLGRTTTTGIVVKKVTSVDFPTKPITKVLYDTPLPSHLIKSLFWLSNYYLVPLPNIAKLILPVGINKTRRKSLKPAPNSPKLPKAPKIALNPAQKTALQGLESASSRTKLLHGITGSGKTNIYLKMASTALSEGNSVVLLVPEIALTSQLVQIFETTFPGRTIIIHSRQTEAERHQVWEQCLQATTPVVVIGPRSALFTPLSNLGLIIIDEAHDSSYFQENTPRYSTLRLASFMANHLKTPCILGTATPLATDYHLAKVHHSLVTLNEKAKPTTPPDISVIDLKSRANFTKNRYFSDQLLSQIKQNLGEHHQTLIFHNRRGSAPLTICENCGYEALCPNCYLPLTLHANDYTLRCHICNHHIPVPVNCPNCQHPGLIHKGFGTKLLENELRRLFPDARIARFDADNTKATSLDALYDEVKSGRIDIIVGTQIIAKGLDLPRLATVGVVQADAGLSLPDYSAPERTFQLLTQVIGRVGRGHLDHTSVIIQTFHPDSPVITAAIHADYPSFASYTLSIRRQQHFPPFAYLARISVTYKTERTTLSKIRALYRELSAISAASNAKFLISPPTPAFHERTARGYTWQLTLRTHSRTQLLALLKPIADRPNTTITLDPPSLL
ncbi:primosomal protein N' [Candidatus Saccharibacteria bacterium]|nr:primosomal protein N' [Candidatus Saccharibacteria bacterium]